MDQDDVHDLSEMLERLPGDGWHVDYAFPQATKRFQGEKGKLTVTVKRRDGGYVADAEFRGDIGELHSPDRPPVDHPSRAVGVALGTLVGRVDRVLEEAFNLASGAGFDVSLDEIARDL